MAPLIVLPGEYLSNPPETNPIPRKAVR
jgi:hypothetical protein